MSYFDLPILVAYRAAFPPFLCILCPKKIYFSFLTKGLAFYKKLWYYVEAV